MNVNIQMFAVTGISNSIRRVSILCISTSVNWKYRYIPSFRRR